MVDSEKSKLPKPHTYLKGEHSSIEETPQDSFNKDMSLLDDEINELH